MLKSVQHPSPRSDVELALPKWSVFPSMPKMRRRYFYYDDDRWSWPTPSPPHPLRLHPPEKWIWNPLPRVKCCLVFFSFSLVVIDWSCSSASPSSRGATDRWSTWTRDTAPWVKCPRISSDTRGRSKNFCWTPITSGTCLKWEEHCFSHEWLTRFLFLFSGN